MKKRICFLPIILIMIILGICIISASYNCSNGGSMSEDQKEIKLGKKVTINGLGIGLIFSDEIPVYLRYTAELIVDAEKVTLSNETSLVYVELKSSRNLISLVNLSSEIAIIKTDSSTNTFYKGEWRKIGILEVSLIDMRGFYPGTGSIDVIVGENKLALSNDQNPNKVMNINNTDYLIELISASEDNAIIRVKKCEKGNIIEIKEVVSPSIVNNSVDNVSTSETKKETPEVNLTSINEENNNNVLKNDSQEIIEKSGSKGDNLFGKIILYFLIAFIVIGIIIIIILYLNTILKS